jgi:inosine/xanthosine triphosphate pyrophosphatase family protein
MSSELTHDEKHAISHRGQAMKVLLERLKLG